MQDGVLPAGLDLIDVQIDQGRPHTDSSRNSSTGGFGIGLSMAHAIVEEHKGHIKALSPEDGIFRITATL